MNHQAMIDKLFFLNNFFYYKHTIIYNNKHIKVFNSHSVDGQKITILVKNLGKNEFRSTNFINNFGLKIFFKKMIIEQWEQNFYKDFSTFFCK